MPQVIFHNMENDKEYSMVIDCIPRKREIVKLPQNVDIDYHIIESPEVDPPFYVVCGIMYKYTRDIHIHIDLYSLERFTDSHLSEY